MQENDTIASALTFERSCTDKTCAYEARNVGHSDKIQTLLLYFNFQYILTRGYFIFGEVTKQPTLTSV